MKPLIRDVILILIAVGLLVAVFVPVSPDPDEDGADETGPPPSTSASSPKSTTTLPKMQTASAGDFSDVPHPLFPLVEGLEWTYMVAGGTRWISARSWRMKVTRVPRGETPGAIRAGFGGEEKEFPVYLESDAVRFAGFPFSFPISLASGEPSKLSGALIPELRRVFSGAVWTQMIEREITYQSMDEQRRVFTERALALQTDRAMVSGPVDMVVPAGVYPAWRVEWTGRLDIRARRKRPVLIELTAEPFRSDVMWFAPGVGMVKRRVTLATHPNDEVTFTLMSLKIINDHEGDLK